MHADREEKLVAARKAYADGLLYLAFDLYQVQADEGHVESQVFVAWMLSQGVGCEKDESQAAAYYERAAVHGHPLGCFYFARWLTRAANMRRPIASMRWAQKSDICPRCFVSAIRWLMAKAFHAIFSGPMKS
jgi:TPR repeat protein